MKVDITNLDVDLGTYNIEYDEEAKEKLIGLGVYFVIAKGAYNLTDDEVILACEYYAKDRDERLKAYEAITTMTEYWEEPS